MENNSIISKALISDIDEIMEIERLGFHDRIRETKDIFEERIIYFPDGFFVIREKERIIGYISAEIWERKDDLSGNMFQLGHSIKEYHTHVGEELYVSSMAIHRDHRGNGLGKRLLLHALDNISLKYKNITSAILIVNEAWKQAQQIYLQEGFNNIMVVEDFFIESENKKYNGIVMRKTL